MGHIDIIILSLEKVEFTKQCIKSVKDYTTLPYHIIVVDNGSSQETVDELKRIDGIRLILNGVNKGFAGGNNIGIKACDGEYVLLLNNDTKVTKGWLEKMVKMAESDDKIGIVGCKLLYPDDTIQNVGVGFRGLSTYHIGVGLPKGYYPKPREIKAVIFACVLIKGEVFDSGVWLDEGYHFGKEDIDFCFQALEKGWKIMYCPDAIVYHYASTTWKSVFSQQKRLEITRRNFLRFKQKWKDRDPIRPKATIPRVAYYIHPFFSDKINMLRLITLSFFFRFYFHLKLKPMNQIFDHLPVTFTTSIRIRWRDWTERRKYKEQLRKLGKQSNDYSPSGGSSLLYRQTNLQTYFPLSK